MNDNIRPMPRLCEPIVRSLYETCHPGWPALPSWHFFAYPTLVAYVSHKIVGYASFSMNVSDQGDLAIFLQDSGVAPKARGLGLGRKLIQARLDIGREMGAKIAIGMTQVDNEAILAIHRRVGSTIGQVVPGAYPQFDPPRDGVLIIHDLTLPRKD